MEPTDKPTTEKEKSCSTVLVEDLPRAQNILIEFKRDSVNYEIPRDSNLLATHSKKLKFTDFLSEARPFKDIEQLLNRVVTVFDLQESSLAETIDKILRKIFQVAQESSCTVHEAKSCLFADSSENWLGNTIQSTTVYKDALTDDDTNWMCTMSNLPTLKRRHLAFAKLRSPLSFNGMKDIRVIIVVLCPCGVKATKNALETGKTFSTLFADNNFRQRILKSTTEEEFKAIIINHAQKVSQCRQSTLENNTDLLHITIPPSEHNETTNVGFQFGKGIREDFLRRLPHYKSDYVDGIFGQRTVHKTVSTTFFLYFAIILPSIAFGVLNDHTTQGRIDVKKVIIGQGIGGLFYAILSGQPLSVIMTTAPLCIFVKIVYDLAENIQVDFDAFYCCVGLWCSFFLALYAFLNVSRLMKWSTRSTEEIFALFISIAFFVDAGRDTSEDFLKNYSNCTKYYSANASKEILSNTNSTETFFSDSNNKNLTKAPTAMPILEALEFTVCHHDRSLLFLLLMLGTLWFGLYLFNFKKTSFFPKNKRDALSDYSLPLAILIASFVGSYIFKDIHLEGFKYEDTHVFKLAPLHKISTAAIFYSLALGFSLSLLILMDQNISSAMVNNPCNQLKKGQAYHWDLMVVAIINCFLSIFTLPWMHAALPHCPLHMRSLGDIEEKLEDGHTYQRIVNVRETRLTGIFSHILIGLSILLLPYPLGYIPVPVLDGLFLYMAMTALQGNQIFERMTLLFTEQVAYPHNYYVRRVPQKIIHQFTGIQIIQLSVMCTIGFVPWPYIKMIFPATLLLLLLVRHKLLPLVFESKYLEALDGAHH